MLRKFWVKVLEAMGFRESKRERLLRRLRELY